MRLKQAAETVSADIRLKQLGHLAEALRDLIAVLEKDPDCPWLTHFELALKQAEALAASEFTRDELVEFSSSVNSVYEKGFRAYVPSTHDAAGSRRRIDGTENFETFAGAVYDWALELRAIGYR